jgi:hypothetical protein
MAKRIKLPDGFADLPDSLCEPEFAPNAATMARFDADPYELQRACSEWMRIVRHPPERMEDDDYPEFDSLTDALRLWASLHGIGDGWQLAEAAAAAYRHEPTGETVWQAEGFIDLMQNRSQIQPTSAGGQQPTAQESARARPKDKRGLTVREVARDHLRVSPDKVRVWIRKRELVASNTSTIPGRTRWIITLEALADFQSRRKPESPTKPAPRRKRQAGAVDFYP